MCPYLGLHGQYIKMSMNKPMFGPVVLEITYGIFIGKGSPPPFFSTIKTPCEYIEFGTCYDSASGRAKAKTIILPLLLIRGEEEQFEAYVFSTVLVKNC